MPLIVKDESHRYVIVNQAMADLHGATATGLRGRTDADFHSPEAVRQYLEEDERVLRTGQPLIMEQAFSALHERRYWVMKHKRRITLPDGKQWIISALLDLTDRKQAEASAGPSPEDAEAALVPKRPQDDVLSDLAALHQSFDDESISFEDFEAAKGLLLAQLAVE